MRVLEVVQGLGRGGAERALLQRIRHAPSDVETVIVNLRPELNALPAPDVPTENFAGSWLSQRTYLQEMVLKYRPDIVLLRTPRDLLNIATWSRGDRCGARVVYEAHLEVATERPSLPDWFIAQLVSLANRRIDHHIAVSQRVAGGALCRGAENISVHYLGAEVDLSVQPVLPTVRGVRFLALGRLVAMKRPDFLVSCVMSEQDVFRKSGSVLTFVGDGPLRERIEHRVREAGISDIVELIGPVEAPDALLCSSDVLVIGSSIEGLPLTVFEAKQFGMRVLSTPAGGTAEVVDASDRITTGFDLEGFAQAMVIEIERGPQSRETRHAVREASRAFAASTTAPEFYRILGSRS